MDEEIELTHPVDGSKPTTATFPPRRRTLLVDKLSRISRNIIKRKKGHFPKQSLDETTTGKLPPADYYYQIDDNAFEIDSDFEDVDENAEKVGYTPIGRNAVEMGSRFYVERNLFSYLKNANIPSDINYYDDDEVDLSCYTRKPVSYIILGKPGIGKTTLATRLAKQFNVVHISPETVIEYYRNQDVIPHLHVNETLESGGTIGDTIVAQLIQARITELDVFHRGYILDGFPMITSEDLPIEEQIEILENLAILPQYTFLLNMQDADLYKRRIEQKYDPNTSVVYIRDHYSKFNSDIGVFPQNSTDNQGGNKYTHGGVNRSKSDVANIQDFSDTFIAPDLGDALSYATQDPGEDPLDGSRDFLPLDHDVIFRLISRTEDNPVLVNDDLEQFRLKLHALQEYIEKFNKRKVFELDAYWAPSALFRRTCEYLESCGERPVCIPVQIMRALDLPIFKRSDSALGEFLGEDDDSEAPCPDDEPPPEIDWESAMRACSVRSQVDPRFRWRISQWHNICPVALKYGRSIIGKPDLATAFLDKIFFLSSPEAVEQFIFNPRPYLLPKMPTSPIKFFIVGHPLAGKSVFAKELAFLTKSTVVDMNHEMEKRYALVKHDYLYKKRLQYTLEAKLLVDREKRKCWRKEERARRAAMHKWIEDYIRTLAELEIRAALEADRARRRAERNAWRKESEFHHINYPIYMDGGICQLDESKNTFKWKDFVASVHGGKTKWEHQELLELAWDLFHQRKLYYKMLRKDTTRMTMFGDLGEDDEEFGLVSNLFDNSSSEEEEYEEEIGEGDAQPEFKPIQKKKRRRRKRCKKIHIKVEDKTQSENAEEQEPNEPLSSDIDPLDNELEESIRMRYPTIPVALVDIVPQPSQVPDHHPNVDDIVNRKLEEDEKYVHSLPVELYIEVLRRACAEAESKYHQHNTHGPLSGGWIVENLMIDIEKWRGILRTPEVCPDQVFLLLDRSDNQIDIYGRLKKLFRIQNTSSRAKSKGKVEPFEIMGEGAFELEGEDALGLDFQDTYKLKPPPTNSEIYQSLLPNDNLTALVADTPSYIIQLMIDSNRERTPDPHDADELETLLTQHERYILEQVRSKIGSSGSVISSNEPISTGALRRQITKKIKSLNCEMSIFLDEDQPPSLSSSKAEQIKEDVRVITEYLRHSRELGNLSFSQEALVKTEMIHSDNEDETGMRSTRSIPGEEGNEMLNDGQANLDELSTPDGLRSITALTNEVNPCAEELTEDEKAKCLREQQEQKIESPKRRFYIQIRLFNEFWNMAVPVCNEQGVKIWEVGLIDEEIAREKGLFYWEEMEKRFNLRARKISENELKEEDEEIHESLVKWGEPYEHNNPKGFSMSKGMKAEKNPEHNMENSDTDLTYEETDDDDDLREDRDILASLEGKPDVYWETVKEIESQRCFGDVKYYCPVTLAEKNILRKGFTKFACKFRDRLYYCGDEECREKFIESPAQYLPIGQPRVPPPPRICFTGSPGCGQEEVALKICKEYNICYVNFRQRMHELMKARFGKDIGPNKTGEVVRRFISEKKVAQCRSGDDLENAADAGEYFEPQSEDVDETNEELLGEIKGEYEIEGKSKPPKFFLLDPSEERTTKEEISANEAVLKSLGFIDTANINTVPIGSVDRTERLTERKWKKLTKIESYVQAFLENGIQLPDGVLDEFIAPLWKEAPFYQIGFVLVGFPNTDADVRYLIKNGYYPEMVYLLDCNPRVIVQRLLISAVDQWHYNRNPSGKIKKKSKSKDYKQKKDKQPDPDEIEPEVWGYDDKISQHITTSLKHYHYIYSKGIDFMKQSLNRNQIDWMPINTDESLPEAKDKLIESISTKILHRSSILEDTVKLNLREANALLSRNYFEISRFNRWCLVEIFNGNTAINLWNAPGIPKIPILYRRYIYFLAGDKNAKSFEENCWQLTGQDTPMEAVPAAVVVMGPPKSGKTSLALMLAERLGLVYISGTQMIESVIKHSFASQYADILNDFEPTTLVDGPQPMILAEEILNYVRLGETVPRFIAYRALDLALMQPRAQYHGVIFDDYPLTEEELQELLYRGIVPSTVIKLNIPILEAYERCVKNRKLDYDYSEPPPEGNAMIDFSTAYYDYTTETTLFWFQNEVQNLLEIDGTLNNDFVFENSAEKCKENAKKMQQYLVNVILEKPSTLEGTCPLTSQIPLRLSTEFGFYCPVALNDSNDLIRVSDISDLSQVVEYKGQVYLFSSDHNVKKFMLDPTKYIPPDCRRTPPKEVPITCLLTKPQFEDLKEHWGFMDFDPVRYFDANHHYKGLQRGSHKFVVAYRNKLYCFISDENMKKFMKKPERYWNQLLPLKVPRKTEPLNMEKITPYSYLIAKGILTEIKKVIKLAGDKRPRVPFMSPDKCAALFMGYYFKSQNMNSTYEVRQKYRSAMFDMMTTKNKTKTFLTELQGYYGCRLKTLPERVRISLDNFLKLEQKKDSEKVLIPTIPGTYLSKATVPVKEDKDIFHRVQTIKEMLFEADALDKIDAFKVFSSRKKAQEESVLIDEKDHGQARKKNKHYHK